MPSNTLSRRKPVRKADTDQQLLVKIARKLQVSESKLQVSEAIELTATQRAKVLSTQPSLVEVALTLTPSFPRNGDNALWLSSPMMVLTGEVSWSVSNKPKTGLALFSSKYWPVTQPTVGVEFDLIDPGKKHLVELYLSCINTSGTYQFRVAPAPVGQTKDLSFGSATKVITEVIDPAPGFSGPCSVSFMQLNPKSQLMSWYFHKVVVTVAG